MVDKILWLDFETYCETPIKDGVYAYAQKVEIMIAAYALDDGPVAVWDATLDPTMPTPLVEALRDSERTVIAHNSNFDRTVLRAVYPDLCPRIERWRDTMVMALAHSLPASLGSLCDVLKIPTDLAKDKEGRRLILQFCKPLGKNRKLRRATRESHPDDWARFVSYAGSDILAMRECYKRMPKWNSTQAEVDLWRLDQKINDRGVAIDVALAKAAVRATDQEQQRLSYQTRIMTLGMVSSATQRDATLDYLRDCGVNLPDLQKATVRDYLAFGDLPQEARELLTIRMQSASTSTAKYDTLIRAVTHDDRLKGTLQFCGASRTGRWAGRTFQPQNLGRPTLKNAAIDTGIAAIKAGIEDLVSDNVMELLSSAVRGCIVAPEGRKLVIADLSNIEGRVLAWLAGETWKIDAFKLYDTLKLDANGDLIPTGKHDDPWERCGHDLYKLAYAKSFGIEAKDVSKDQRQVGKVMELALGYQGSVGAFVTFAAAYGIDLEKMAESALSAISKEAWDSSKGMYQWAKEKGMSTFDLSETAWIVCDVFKAAWRQAHPAVSSYWRDVEKAIQAAVSCPSHVICVGGDYDLVEQIAAAKVRREFNGRVGHYRRGHFRRIQSGQQVWVSPCWVDETGEETKLGVKVISKRQGPTIAISNEGSWLRVRLPSGRYLCYPTIKVDEEGKITYFGVDQFTKKWRRQDTYGGKIVENITQAVARDVLAYSMPHIEKAGYDICLTVHDEVISETPDTDDYNSETLAEIMSTTHEWAEGLPLAAAGFETYRYRKD
jgi:DNA polymerase